MFEEGFNGNEQTCSKNGAPDLVAAKCFGDIEGGRAREQVRVIPRNFPKESSPGPDGRNFRGAKGGGLFRGRDGQVRRGG